MRFKTRRRLFIVALLAVVSPLQLLLKAMVAAPAIELLLLDIDDWSATHG